MISDRPKRRAGEYLDARVLGQRIKIPRGNGGSYDDLEVTVDEVIHRADGTYVVSYTSGDRVEYRIPGGRVVEVPA
jgi:hypothetical protein